MHQKCEKWAKDVLSVLISAYHLSNKCTNMYNEDTDRSSSLFVVENRFTLWYTEEKNGGRKKGHKAIAPVD